MMKYCKLRIAWSLAWGIVAVLLIALWIRSYTHSAEFHKNGFNSWAFITSTSPYVQRYGNNVPGGSRTSRVESRFNMPYWLPTMLFIAIGILSSYSELHWRFTLRTLLIVTTLVAIGLGLIVWLG
jgi:hypothetical protein